MQRKHTLAMMVALLGAGIVTHATAQTVSPSFFGTSSTTANPTAASTPAKAPVLTKDQFLQQVTGLKAANEAQFQQNLKAQLKPLPTKAATPGSTPTTTATAAPSTAATPTTPATPAPAAPATPATPSGYTGFGASTPGASGTTPTTPTKSSSGWNVTY